MKALMESLEKRKLASITVTESNGYVEVVGDNDSSNVVINISYPNSVPTITIIDATAWPWTPQSFTATQVHAFLGDSTDEVAVYFEQSGRTGYANSAFSSIHVEAGGGDDYIVSNIGDQSNFGLEPLISLAGEDGDDTFEVDGHVYISDAGTDSTVNINWTDGESNAIELNFNLTGTAYITSNIGSGYATAGTMQGTLTFDSLLDTSLVYIGYGGYTRSPVSGNFAP